MVMSFQIFLMFRNNFGKKVKIKDPKMLLNIVKSKILKLQLSLKILRVEILV